MRRRSRTRRVMKWVGTACCMLIAGIWLFSGWYQIVLLYDGQHAAASVGIFYIQWGRRAIWEQVRQAEPNRPPWPSASEDLPRVRLAKCDDPPQFHWMLPRWRAGGYDKQAAVWTMQSSLWIPFWLAFVLLAIPTALLWWRDLDRIPPGACQSCGYNLTANVSGRCPECGTAVKPEAEIR